MKFYRVEWTGEQKIRWSTSAAGAAAARKEFMDEGAKRADLESSEHEIGSTKAELLEWLNNNQV